MKYAVLILGLLALGSHAARAEVQTKAVRYEEGGTTLQGFLAWDETQSGKRPGVLVVHEWWGLNDYARQRAEQLAELGYVAFALDMYGEGKVTKHPEQAGQWASQIRANTDNWRRRALAGLKVLKSDPHVDPDRLAAIGYCFGGSTVIQLALAGEELAGVVSFHGALPAPEGDLRGKIKASILVCHGAADAFIPEESAATFRAAMERAGADWQMIYYANARHGFTNPDAGDYGLENLKYDAHADARSWRQMQDFFAEVLGAKTGR